jgi:hypothetical protein
MKIRILNEDGISYKTKIINVETGEELEGVGCVELNFYAQSGPIQARITQYWTPIDVVVDAEIRQVCPCCGKPKE